MKKILCLVFITTFIYANNIETNKESTPTKSINNEQEEFTLTLDWLEQKPKTITKDFYILQYLKQDITPDEALKALSMVKYVSNQIFYAFAKKFKHDETTAVVQCMQANAKELINTYDDCIKAGLSLYKATKLSQVELNEAILKVKDKYPTFANKLKILASSLPFTKTISASKDDFFDIYLKTGSQFKIDFLNYKLPKKTLNKIKNDKRVETLIKYAITNPQLDLLSKSFLGINDTTFNSLTSFFLALNEINNENLKQALTYLSNSYKKAYNDYGKNRAIFWKYLITYDKKFLEELSSSNNLDIYSLYAKELLNKKIDNIIYDISLKQNETNSTFNTNDPFSWVDLIINSKNINKEKLKEYKAIFSKEETKPYLVYVLNKYYKYKNYYFITPYENYLKEYSVHRKALVYAIARQESGFIPASISTAFAQGVMQIMPFLSKHIAKKLDEPYDIYKLFDAKTNLKYANYHLDNLEKNLDNPLFIAYSYNGGYGYFKYQKKLGLFTKNSDFEPFMSMELISYDETREYGKKVLANYYIYKNYLDNKNKFKLSSIFENLIESDQN
ncbi:lytic transglycosylase domain-containing protein [Malaciobacter canalis]|uniref:lytic transglycosylase domain-containing protein n=1 Tax=Malaciobacter canalis TaxID=1912871 RepID=UPI00384DDCB7